MKSLIPAFLFLQLIASCATPSKSDLDAEVTRLCAIDGGIKIYETVTMSADRFNQYGQINFYRPTQGENALGSEYIYNSEENIYREGNTSMARYRHKVLRRLDRKLLGETISYGRGGGEISGPWEPSNYHCPPTSESSEIALFKRIFSAENK